MAETVRTRPKVVLDLETAGEVVDLVRDKPGDANEALLDNALVALRRAEPTIGPDDQQRAADGEVVAIEVTPTAAQAIETLIEENREIEEKQLRRFADRLRAKVNKARKRRNDD